MERTLSVLFLVLVGLFCGILSSSYGRKIPSVPGKTVIRDLYANPNHVETVNIKCTDCENENIRDSHLKALSRQRSSKLNNANRERRKNDRKNKIRRGRKSKNSARLLHPSDVMAASDPSIYQSRDQQRHPQLPDAVARLERKLHPSLSHSVGNLKKTLTDILQKMKRKLEEMKLERTTSQISARDSMMKVREELQHITTENNNAYDVILDVSQLTRMVLLKQQQQQQQGVPAPVHSIQKPTVIWERGKTSRRQKLKVQNQCGVVNNTFNKVMSMKMNFVQQDARVVHLNDVMKNGMSDLDRLRDLKYHARRVLRDLYIGIENTTVHKEIDRYKQFEKNLRALGDETRTLAASAYRDLKYAQRTYLDNEDLKKKIAEERRQNGKHSRKRRSSRADARQLVNRAYSKSSFLQKSEETLNRTLLPILLKAEQMTQGDGALPVLIQLQRTGSRLKSYIKKIDRVLDDLRNFLGNEAVIEERCRNLIATGGYDVNFSVLDCTPYCDGFGSGCGSGDGSIVDPDEPLQPSAIPHVNDTDIGASGDGDGDFIFIDKDEITLAPKNLETTSTSTTTFPTTTKKEKGWWEWIGGNSDEKITTPTTIPKSTTTTSPSTTPSTVKTTPKTTRVITTSTTTTTMPTSTTTVPTSTSTTTTPSTTTPTTTTTPSTTTTPTTTTTPSTTTTRTTTTTSVPTTTATPSTTITPTATTTPATTTTPSTTTPVPTTTTTPSTTTTPTTTTPTTTKTPTTTTTPSTTTTPVPTTTTTPTITTATRTSKETTIDTAISGSGDIDDSDTVVDLQPTKSPNINGGNDDFIIVDATKDRVSSTTKAPETTTEASRWPWWLLKDDPNSGYPNVFNEKLREKAHLYKTKSEDLFENSITIQKRLADITRRKTLLSRQKEELEVYVSNLTEITIVVNNTKATKTIVDQKIDRILKPLEDKLEAILNKTDVLGKIAKEKIAEYEDTSVSSTESRKSEQILSDLFAKMSEIRQNRIESKRILNVNANPCRKIQSSASKLRTNIAELRKKIQTAKRIASAMPASISMNGKQVMNVSATSVPLVSSPFSAFGFCLKPDKESMAIATLHSPSATKWVVELEDKKPKISFYDSVGKKVGQLTSKTDVTLEKWIDLKILKYGSSILLNRTDIETFESLVEAKAVVGLPFVVEQPRWAVLGFAKDKDNFTGCLSDVTLNDEKLGLLSSTVKKEPCKSNCISNDKAVSMVFDGDGFVKYSVDMIYQSYPIKEITFHYQTHQENGILMLLNDRLQDLQVLVSIMDCRLHIEARMNRGTTVVRSNSTNYCDGNKRFVKIIFGQDIEIRTSNTNEVFIPESSTQEITPSIDDGIYLGGLGSQNKMISGKSKLRALVGCISNLLIQNKMFPFYMAESSKDVHLGNCKHNAWFKCVKFVDKSKQIVLEKGRNAEFLSLAITRDSIGRVLNYKTEYFDIDVFVDGNGLEIVDNKEDERHPLTSPSEHSNHWFVLSLHHNDKRVTARLNDSAVHVEYSTGWLFSGDTDVKYTVTLGPSDDGSEPFTGGIANLIIDDRETVLDDFRISHDLQSCRRPLIDALDTADMMEKFVC